MNRSQALTTIQSIFGTYTTLTGGEQAWLRNLKSGKLYELYCLSKVIEDLSRTYGFRVLFRGASIRFKLSPGKIHSGDPHFELSYGGNDYCLYTDVEFATLGAGQGGAGDLSDHHELDLILVEVGVAGQPTYDDIVLGVECKSHANFNKAIVKEVLGIRREMCLYNRRCGNSKLSAAAGRVRTINADPGSEYWLAFVDRNGMNYASSPSVFSIDFKHWQP